MQECCELKLPTILEHKIAKPQWKTLIKKAILKENEEDLKKKMLKLDNGEMVNGKCERKESIKTLSVGDAMHIFLKNSCMTRYVKMNYMSDFQNVKGLWQCDSCQRNIDIISVGGGITHPPPTKNHRKIL